MNLRTLMLAALVFSFGVANAQEDIVKIIDDLTVEWDQAAVKLETYEGLEHYCHDRSYRDNTIKLLNTIHHYDSMLYKVVTEKYANHQDAESKATLDDIKMLEMDYATKQFLTFLRSECGSLNDNEQNKNVKGYHSKSKELEKEMVRYVDAVTKQIDIIDEHVHHLKGL